MVFSDETKKKLSESHKGFKMSESTKRKKINTSSTINTR